MAGPSPYFAVSETPAFSLLVTAYEKRGHSKLRADLAWLNDKLGQSPETMGDRPPQLQKLRLPIYKTRCKDSCHGIGQSGGWRVYYATDKEARKVSLLFLHHKRECENPGTAFLMQKLERAFAAGLKGMAGQQSAE